MKINHNTFARKKLLALAVPMLMFGQAQAVEFEFGEASLTIDSQLSLGSSWRMEKQNDNLIDYKGIGAKGGNTLDANTSSDGNLNYDKGDAFSQIFKGSHDIQLTYQNFGAFVRAKYWYDSAIENNSVNHGHSPTLTKAPNLVVPAGTPLSATFTTPADVTAPGVTYAGKSKLDDSDFNELSKGSGATILDAFVYGSFDIGEMPLDVRLGKQVLSWGESTFIRNGVNQINALDIAAARRPGAEVKEVLLPSNMISASLGVTDSLSVDAFYLLEYDQHIGNGCGTYFSSADIGVEGCTELSYFNSGLGGLVSLSQLEGDDGYRTASDDGQYGVAVRYFSDTLDTEFGFYAMNVHSKAANYGYRRGSGDGLDAIISPAVDLLNSGGFFMEFVEDQKILGMSFAGNVNGIALSGEISHKIDVPISINGTLMTTTALTGGDAGANDGDQTAETAAAELAAYTEIMGNTTAGDDVHGYRQFDVTQIQSTIYAVENRLFGSSISGVLAEIGVSYVHDFDEVLRYGKNSIFQGPTFDGDSDFDSGFMTEIAWGYRATFFARYSNALAGMDLTPVVSFSHDVDGYDGQFQEDVKSLGVTLKANYLQRYDASIGYTAYMGGKFNPIKDRDFLAISAGVQF